MDDSVFPRDAKDVEFWIHEQCLQRRQTTFIADELLKRWQRQLLTREGKQSFGRFCLLNGFYAPLIRALKNDLKTGEIITWDILIEVIQLQKISLSRKLVDGCLSGATRDKQLLEVSAAAVLFDSEDSRWQKIFESELKDRKLANPVSKAEMFQEIKILQQEGMHDELRESVSQILKAYPDDRDAQKIKKTLEEEEVLKSFEIIRKAHARQARPVCQNESANWPELSQALAVKKNKFDLESAYHLSVGLFEMGLLREAQEILEAQKENWRMNEKLFAVEIMLERKIFASALDQIQNLLKSKESDQVMTALVYFLAKAYHGLADDEQAIGILRALVETHPHFRDAASLILQWEAEST